MTTRAPAVLKNDPNYWYKWLCVVFLWVKIVAINAIILCDIFGLKIHLCRYLWQISCVQACQTGQDPGCQDSIADDASTQHCLPQDCLQDCSSKYHHSITSSLYELLWTYKRSLYFPDVFLVSCWKNRNSGWCQNFVENFRQLIWSWQMYSEPRKCWSIFPNSLGDGKPPFDLPSPIFSS